MITQHFRPRGKTAHIIHHAAAAGILALLLGACRSQQVTLNSRQAQVAKDLAQITPHQDPQGLPASTEIIDIHTHTFNARYLPLEGILLGKRDASPVATLLSDNTARLIAKALIQLTELADLPDGSGKARMLSTQEIRTTGRPGFVAKVFLNLIDKAVISGAWKPGSTATEKVAAIDDVAEHMSPMERIAVRAAADMMGMKEHSTGGQHNTDSITGIQAAVRFLWTLTQNDLDMAKLLREMHAGAPKKGQISIVSHMMDLGPVYRQESSADLLRFETEQIQRMKFQSRPGSGLLYFIAYNPYRANPSGGGDSPALALVRDAVLNHGARGVKVYPPSGYRAAGNEIKRRPRPLFTREPGKQWAARYERFGSSAAARNQGLDEEINALLEWCIKTDTPVFTHAGHGEFEARKGYGVYHSNPAFWEQFLQSHSLPGKPCKLRLCLGHAGGEDYWFDTGEFKPWGERVYNMCVTYPNVYCEITTGDLMVIPERRAIFADTVAGLFAKSNLAVAEHKRTQAAGEGPFLFAKKLMYGTDWPLPDKGKPAAVLLGAQQVFLHSSLRDHYTDYFSGNARRYLKNP